MNFCGVGPVPTGQIAKNRPEGTGPTVTGLIEPGLIEFGMAELKQKKAVGGDPTAFIS